MTLPDVTPRPEQLMFAAWAETVDDRGKGHGGRCDDSLHGYSFCQR
jgi:hypothetical protein